MQKKLIAVAVAGLMSSGAFAQVTVGGKFDAGYQFKKTANTDSGTGGPNGGKTTETQADGSAATTRVTVSAREDLGKGISAGVSYDIRFGNVHEGKTGLTSNDKKAMTLTVPGVTFQWGVANLMSNDYKLAEKPYMVSPKDWEAVKFGVSQFREESLTNRNTSFWTAPIGSSSVGIIFKGSFAGGDNRKAGNNNDAASNVAITSTTTSAGVATLVTLTTHQGVVQRAGDVYVLGTEFKITDMVNGGFDYTRKTPSSYSGGVANTAGFEDGMIFTHSYINIKPMKGLKIGLGYNEYKGYAQNGASTSGQNSAFQEKTTNLVINYTIGDLGLGVGFSHLHDVGGNTIRNSGKAMMLGAFYQLSKQTAAYIGYSKTDWERNTGALSNSKYVGSGTNFLGNTGTKVDEKYLRVGVVKDF